LDEKLFDDAVNHAKEKADKRLEDAIKKVDLSGEEVLDLLNKGMPPKIQEIFDQILKDTIDDIKQDTGVGFDPFIQKYPLEIDEQELERVKKQEIGKQQVKSFK
jgi:F0F1-type ATP synthase membrane subunit b/b'